MVNFYIDNYELLEGSGPEIVDEENEVILKERVLALTRAFKGKETMLFLGE